MRRKDHRSALSPRFHEMLKARRAVRHPLLIARDTGLKVDTVTRALQGHTLNPATRQTLERYLALFLKPVNDNGVELTSDA